MVHQPTAPPDPTGPWHVEPVHDAIVTARLSDLQTPITAVAPTRRRAGRLRGIRLRVGHALVALGSFVEGCSEPPEAPVTVRSA